MMKIHFFILFCFFITSCALTEPPTNSLFVSAPRNTVWEAMKEVFKSYPLKTVDKHLGVIETKELKGSKFWQAPHYEAPNTFGYSSVIVVRLSYRKPMVRIYITKKVYKQEGFMSLRRKCF